MRFGVRVKMQFTEARERNGLEKHFYSDPKSVLRPESIGGFLA